MTETAIGRQRMNNARWPSRPPYGCAISMECATFESFLATWLDVFRALVLTCGWAEAIPHAAHAPHEQGLLWIAVQVTGKLMISKSVYSVSWLVDQSRS